MRNMMGLLGNVAEVPELRSQLMTTSFVAEFKMLLESSADGIEVKIINPADTTVSLNFTGLTCHYGLVLSLRCRS